ncbi:hypothetical protein I545_1089 [Mycobacterium kansasii 662]|uniref:Uncharacterized protein n=2 Tax=Mycobacterium kansasii TaxID=1768 RepID=U5WYX4_MYCKA|nr:hypothetical protein MKAN_24545 [Mycobacterium kansasii ATCC 12478]EUA03401.1 hypothetical protein I547_0151 [Mycobacterium kansasii 824]EUA22306.1 hypothetical protein I545_1089 [Mycobacterium kansasii 662]KEP42821.1 hypothetical protein MKSMC1_20050 [Mycobacterium kansasii]
MHLAFVAIHRFAAPKLLLSLDQAESATDGSYRDRVGGTVCLPTMQPARRAAPAG